MSLLPILLALAFQDTADPVIAPNQPTVVSSVESDSYLFPPQASTFAEINDDAYYFIHWVNVIFTVLIFGILFYFIWRFGRSRHARSERTSTHSTPLELLWTIPPCFILAWVFWEGFVGFVDARTMPQDAYEIDVQAMKWNWTFRHPGGIVKDSNLHVPVDTPVVLTLRSSDVLHSCFIPAFRVKMDVVPGRYTKLWFQANQTGEFALFCTEYCGTNHSKMWAKVFVHSKEDFDAWYAKASDLYTGNPPEDNGRLVYINNGCSQCHSLDGSILQAPSFKGLFGKTEQLTNGSSVTVDENYVRESILQPAAKVVAGFTPNMPTFQGQLTDDEVDYLIAFIKSLKD